MLFEFELICENLYRMRELGFFCLRADAAVSEQTPQKPTRKKVYSANILLYGSFWGVCICADPSQPAKAVSPKLQTRFVGRRFAGSARVALRRLLLDLIHCKLSTAI